MTHAAGNTAGDVGDDVGDGAASVLLRAVRFPLEPGPPIDPFALAGPEGIVFHADGRVLVGLGAALTIDLPHGLDVGADLDRAAQALAALPYDDHVSADAVPKDGPAGSRRGIIGFGTLPFDRSAPGGLVLPEITYGSEPDGLEWLTVVGTDRAELPSSPTGLRAWLTAGPAGVSRGPDRPDGRRSTVIGPGAGPPPSESPVPSDPSGVEARFPDESFLAMVAEALESIERGEVVKVVLARRADVTMGAPIDVPDLLRRWRQLEPACTVFSLPTGHGQLVGASPELLVERTGSRIRSRPLAGTAERFIGSQGSALPDELLESRKDGTEHRLVVDAIEAALRPLCSELDAPDRPDLVQLSNIVHLGTSVTGTLARRPDGTVPGALDLVAALHPTPAVGGAPAAPAAALIGRLEPESRGHYAGPVGYVDGDGDGRWMVGIRAMTVDGPTAQLAAGVGIVAGSRPETELVETNLKLTAILEALSPGLAMDWWERTGHRTGVR